MRQNTNRNFVPVSRNKILFIFLLCVSMRALFLLYSSVRNWWQMTKLVWGLRGTTTLVRTRNQTFRMTSDWSGRLTVMSMATGRTRNHKKEKPSIDNSTIISPDHEVCVENYWHQSQSPFSSFFFFSPFAFPRLLLGAMHTPSGARAQLNQPNCTIDGKQWLSSTRM